VARKARPRNARSERKPVRTIAIVAALLASSTMVWQSSYAAFSSTTTNPGNSWAAGTVTISDDDSGTAMFAATGLTPSSSAGVKCIKVTYTGNVAAPVKLNGANITGTLGTYLNLTIDVGAAAGPGAFANCGAFAVSSSIYSPGTVAAFNSSYTSYAAGLSTGWTPSVNGDYRVFRFTYTVANNNAANGASCTADFVWEAQA
jgi:hypothetical protein